ncbi:MAG: DUF445 family protein [Firmicutes bacterium]|nr:DUF445 family protein [Bacillota bacterium]
MDRIYLVSPIIGAIIGYITNWVAIKMLFRPLKKVYIGPLGLPFTPGLIPKERKRIAKSIADAIGENLLNPEYLAKEAVSADKLLAIEGFIDKKLLAFENSEKTIKDMLQSFGDADKMLISLSKYLSEKLTSEDFVNRYIDGLTESVSLSLEDYLKDNLAIKEKLQRALIDRLSSEDKSLKELLPDEILKNIPIWSAKISQSFATSVEEYVEKPTTEQLIKTHIDNYLKKGPLRNLLGMFLDTSLISKQLGQAVISFVKEPENQSYLTGIVVSKIDGFLLMKPEELLEKIGEDSLQLVVYQGTELFFSKRNIENLFSKDHLVEFICSERTKEKVDSAILSLTNQTKEVKLQKIYNLYGEKSWRDLKMKALNLYQKRAPDLLIGVFREFNLTNIIEEKINSFDLLELEKLIFGISQKELGAITLLGGLLGFLMGLLTPLINTLLR